LFDVRSEGSPSDALRAASMRHNDEKKRPPIPSFLPPHSKTLSLYSLSLLCFDPFANGRSRLKHTEEGSVADKRTTKKLSSEERKERKEKLRQNKLEKIEEKEERKKDKEMQRGSSFKSPPPIKEMLEQ
jgi:hypothetical protein